MEERLQKLIAEAGIASRRKAEELITSGRVRVNGQVVTELGTKASRGDLIEVDGKPIRREEKVYFLLNKPKKTICTVSDEKGRDTVLSYMPDVKERIFPVGRLDYDTTGCLIMTNDGDFANLMMHPRSHVPKVYEAAIDGILLPDEIAALRRGIPLEEGMTLPASIHISSVNEKKMKTIFSIMIYEGRNREIKRMMEYFHHSVTRLERKKYGFLDCQGLRQGEYRRLRRYEVRQLIQMAETGRISVDGKTQG